MHDHCFADEVNRMITEEVARRCYLPANALLLKLIRQHPNVRVAFSISGVALNQFEQYAPEVIESFRRLAETGCVEFLTETYYHSLSCLVPGQEFEHQIKQHRKKIVTLFGTSSSVFRNTELIYSHETGQRIRALGFGGVLIDGVDRILSGRLPHTPFVDAFTPDLTLLTRDYRLSDEIAFRYASHERPLTAARYVRWLERTPAESKVIVLGMDYETFGEHQRQERGIFGFMEALFLRLACHDDFQMVTPSQVTGTLPATETLSVPGYVSWADQERDMSAWLGNDMQRDAFDFLKRLGSIVEKLHDPALLETWRSLQTSDHFYYMSTKTGSDGEVHNYFSPYPSPYEAFINYMNVLTDFSEQVRALHPTAVQRLHPSDADTGPDALTVQPIDA